MFYPRIKSEIREPDPRDEEFYQDKLYILEHVRDVLLRNIEQLRLESEEQQGRDPVDHCKSRIKSALSMEEKLTRRGLPVTLTAALENIRDAVGVRVVCPFLDDVYLVRDWLSGCPGLRLVEEKDYIANPKPNGYRSLHLIVETPIFLHDQKRLMRVEVQFRTISMDWWASLEHKIRYKKNLPEMEYVERELYECAEISAQLDARMEKLQKIAAQATEGKDRALSS